MFFFFFSLHYFQVEGDLNLSKRKQHKEYPITEEKVNHLKLLNIQIEANDSTCSSLKDKINQLTSKLDKLCDELQTHREQKSMLETQKVTLEKSHARDVTSITSIKQKRKNLEDRFLQMINGD